MQCRRWRLLSQGVLSACIVSAAEDRKTGPFPFENAYLGAGAAEQLGVNSKYWPIYLLLLTLLAI